MRRVFFVIIYALTVNFSASASESSTIILDMVHVTATGNNEHEAKIAALHYGRQNALKLALKTKEIVLSEKQVSQVPYHKLRDCINIKEINNESLSSVSYCADVTFSCFMPKILNLVSCYFPQYKHLAQTYEVLIPLVKRNTRLYSSNTNWHSAWQRSKKDLKILGVSVVQVPLRHTKARYEDLRKLFPTMIKDTITLATEELFFISEGIFKVEVQYTVLSQNTKKEFTKTYNAASEYLALQQAVTEFIDALRTRKPSNVTVRYKNKAKIITCSFDNKEFSEQLALQYSKIYGTIVKMQNIKGTRLITVKTLLNENELAEEMFIRKLSYYKEKDMYSIVRRCN
ncbi:hypothetical protein [Candidatus Sneabacter namystus]|uniref:DUF2066 domain-containing protein n=1 Tax=Candidatus Sneabacter namystus TaxID=2601646 RepID=A0A5C0UIX4_9RICK|nr:hypothetical protein [Candidatus Sneabacter namystus]QEK39561.1 hypothetical protein FZC37_01240 [Candidatus Sneabacter namystus]